MRKYKTQILSDLLARYESSDVFRTGAQTRRIFLPKSTLAKLTAVMESPDEKQEILECLEDLSDQGLLSFSWEKHEEGNLISRVWLNTDPDAIEKSYKVSGRVNAKRQQEWLIQRLSAAAEEVPEGEIREFLLEQRAWVCEKHKIPRFFTGKQTEDERLFLCLTFLAGNTGEVSERVLSSRLFGDSKIFERSVRALVLKVLRAIEKQNEEEPLRDEEVLQKYGIVRWPEIMEFCGRISCELDDGSLIDYQNSIYGACINSDTVLHIRNIRFHNVRRVLFIENKANYIWYVRSQRQSDELVIFHGGFFSPAKGSFFSLLYRDGKDVKSWEHWSDIDLGGFRIFQRLKSKVILSLQPCYMDIQTLLEREADCMRIEDDTYLKKLELLLTDPSYEIFHDLIRVMIQKKIRLEQEQLIWEQSEH